MLKTEGYENSELFMGLTPKYGYKASKLYSYKPIDGTGDFVWNRNHTAYRLNQSGVLELMGNNVPRVDHSNTCPELLIEKASTNIALQSETFDNATWQSINITKTANYAEAPNGTTTADRIQATGGSVLYQSITTIATTYTISFWIKSANGSNQTLRIFLQGGAITGNNITATNEWQRITQTFNGNATTNDYGIWRDASANSYDILIWGFQLEQSDYVTSYIPTTNTSQTRPQDVSYNTANVYGDAAWSIVMRVRLNNIGSNTFEPLVSLNDGSTDNYFCIYTDANPKLYFDWYNNPDQETLSTTDLTNGIYNIGISYDDATGDYIVAINGTMEFTGNVGVSLAGAFTGSFNRLDLGSIAGTGSPDGDGIIGIQYYDTALTQSDLENLTA